MSFKTYVGIMTAIIIIAIGISVVNLDLFAESVHREVVQSEQVQEEHEQVVDNGLPDNWFIVTDGDGHYTFGHDKWTNSMDTYDSYEDALRSAKHLYRYLQERERVKNLIWEKVKE